jgi:hypothetical protein
MRSEGGDDLDVLIGELQREAARRRAEHGFPLDEEARIGIELDRQAPQPLAPKLERLARAAEATASPGPTPAGRTALSPRGPSTWGLSQRAVSAVLGSLPDQVASLALVVSGALRTLSMRLSDLESRLERLEGSVRTEVHPEVRPEAAGGGDGKPPPDAGPMSNTAALLEGMPPLTGRVLYAGPDAEEVVHALRRRGVDAYGLTPVGDPYQDHPDVRPGALLEHVRASGDGSLGAVVLTGHTGTVDPTGLAELAGELARVADTVIVVAEAPWWWRERVGPEQADTDPARPLNAETWLAVLHRAGFEGVVQYDDKAGRYRVVASGP